MHIALREGNRNPILVQSVVDQFFCTVYVTHTLGHKHLLLHGYGNRAVVHLLQGNADAALRVHDLTTESVLVLQRLQGLTNS